MITKKYQLLICCFFVCSLLISCVESSFAGKNKNNVKDQSKKRTTVRRPQLRQRKTDSTKFTAVFDENSQDKPEKKEKRELQKLEGFSTVILGFYMTPEDNIALYKYAEQWQGTPHRMGGCTTEGIDCSCFVLIVYKEIYGIDLSRSSREIALETRKIEKNQLREGDLVFFKNNNGRINHVGIYLRNNKFIHSSTSKGVIVSDLDEDYWKRKFYTAGRHQMLENR